MRRLPSFVLSALSSRHSAAAVFLAIFLAGIVLVPTTICPASDRKENSSTVQGMLRREKDRAERQRREIKSLKTHEAKLGQRLRDIENRVAALTRGIESQQQALDDIESHAENARVRYLQLADHRSHVAKRLRGLLAALWPVHLQNLQSRFGSLDNWPSADRHFTWLAAIYRQTRTAFGQAVEATRQMQANLQEQQELAQAARDQLAQVNALKDRLLTDRLDLRAGLREISGRKMDLQQKLNDILKVIKDLNYRLDSSQSKSLNRHSRLLPWPAQGRVVASFSPNANPPVRGIGLALPSGATIRSVSWGKVVHNDVLRGFGRVVIIYHGEDYYSLYAFLGDGLVATGQKVKPNDPIGRAGFYPEADGPGLYFELRLGQKAINPINWLSPR